MAVTERAPRTRALVPTDLFAVDDLLGDDERLIRDTVRAFVRERALPVIPEHFEAGTFPRELIPEVAETRAAGYASAGLRMCGHVGDRLRGRVRGARGR